MVDVSGLQAAQARLLAIARADRFGPPPGPGDWTAEQILAHITTVDRLLIATTAELLAGGTPRHDTTVARRVDHLNALVAGVGDYRGLLAQVQATGLELVALVGRLTTGQAQAEVIVAGDPVPWGAVLRHHAEVHLPSHTAQLKALRG